MINDVNAAADKPCAEHLKWEADTAAWRKSEKVAAEEMARQDERAAKLLKGLRNGD
ncbi:hypothetical protein [Phyllobacterium bourgognense]|uniref:Uncharacterized protein n=1 Tax=Phyllobacterium bourgognense TaxID=314236 RepID=A0A368YL20_9HYPH|nr:hypothetical protein [Phyllobacterium bourgognense]RCW80932.1 hypothetical protein C7476_11288 [Phyllobacterium bourgognense]